MFAASLLSACSAADIVGEAESSNQLTISSEVVKSPAGALALYRGALLAQAGAVAGFIGAAATLTDERRVRFDASSNGLQGTGLDRRVLQANDIDDAFQSLQLTRANARQGRAILAQYAPSAPKDLIGHLYAVEAMADVMLADLYCSGIPLSTVNPDGTFTLAAGSTTAQVYRGAVALFDSALAFAVTPDSTRFRYFAQVGKARALLALGQYDSAAATVRDVPTDYAYLTQGGSVFAAPNGTHGFYVSDREGGTGLPYASSGDPRSAVTEVSDPNSFFPPYVATKYNPNGQTPVVLVNGVEARLIEAEADLRADSTQWLAILNTLRTDSTYTVTGSDTLWHVGTGGVAGLRPLTDPGTLSARLDLLFVERAEWLFLTGHRQGDLRRRVRNDHVPQQAIYPSGGYPGGGLYGTDVTLPVPSDEQAANRNYHGCINREA